MIRFLFRFIGLLLLALAFIFLVYDGTRSIADQTWLITTVGSFWSSIHQNSLIQLQSGIERSIAVWLWRSLIQPYFLEQPIWLVLTILGTLLIVLGRKKKPLIGYARD